MTAKNVYQRLAAVMEEVTYIQKEKKQGMQYTIVSHDAVTAKVRPALLKHGIVYHPIRCEYSHNGNRAECAMTVRFVNIDAPADFFDVPSFGYGIDPQDKGPGKAMSYAVKYALLKALGLETGDDPDNDSIAHEPASAPQRKPVAAESNNPAPEQPSLYKRLSVANSDCRNKDDFNALWGDQRTIKAQNSLSEGEYEQLEAEKATKFKELDKAEPSDYHPPNLDDLPEPTQQAVKNLGA